MKTQAKDNVGELAAKKIQNMPIHWHVEWPKLPAGTEKVLAVVKYRTEGVFPPESREMRFWFTKDQVNQIVPEEWRKNQYAMPNVCRKVEEIRGQKNKEIKQIISDHYESVTLSNPVRESSGFRVLSSLERFEQADIRAALMEEALMLAVLESTKDIVCFQDGNRGVRY